MAMDYMKAFIVGGLLCVIGQVLLQRTKLTPARIVVIFVTAGAILTGIGLYEPLVKWAGCGATAALNREYLSYNYVGDISASGRSPPHQ